MRGWFLALWIVIASYFIPQWEGYAAPTKTLDIAGLSVAVWIPEKTDHAPVVLFSHGFHGCDTQSAFLMEALANAGYAVFAPNHQDAACHNVFKWLQRSEVPFKDSDKWTDATYADRGRDIHNLLDALTNDKRFSMLDWQRVGIAGHSLGGYTALAVAGAWPKWKDKRIKAVLALSPYCSPFILQHTLSQLDVPVMYQGGTHDPGITPFVNKGNGAYDQTSLPKFYVEFDGAGHFAWTDLRSTYHDDIDTYSIAFFDQYLKDKHFPESLTQTRKGISKVWVDLK